MGLCLSSCNHPPFASSGSILAPKEGCQTNEINSHPVDGAGGGVNVLCNTAVAQASTPAATGTSARSPDVTSHLAALQVRQSNVLTTPQELLADISLQTFLGAGTSCSAVYLAYWRGTTPCAVKVVRTPATDPALVRSAADGAWDSALLLASASLHSVPSMDVAATPAPTSSASSSHQQPKAVQHTATPTPTSVHHAMVGVLPAHIRGEVLISKDLRHPHIITTYATRCCLLSTEWLAAVRAARPTPAATPNPTSSWSATCHSTGSARHTAAAERLLMSTGDVCLSPSSISQHGPLTSTRLESELAAAANALLFSSQARAARGVGAARVAAAYSGTTPLGPVTHRSSHRLRAAHTGIKRSSAAAVSMAIGDALAGGCKPKGAPVSWSELLQQVGAQQGDCVSVIIMELATMGTLWQAMRKRTFCAANPEDHFPTHMRWRALLRTACEIASALEHLHKNGIIHGNIKPGNVLLSGSRTDKRGFKVMVSDFALTRATSNSIGVSVEEQDTLHLQYLAPEVFMEARQSKRSDIFAFGMLLWELATCEQAYAGLLTGDVVKAVVHEKARLPWPADACPLLQPLYESCVHHDPACRPTAADCVRALIEIEDTLRTSVRAQQAAQRQQQS